MSQTLRLLLRAAQAAPGATVRITQTSGAAAPHGMASAATAERWVELVAVLVLAGVMVFRLAMLRAAAWPAGALADAADRARRLAQAMLVLFAITTLARLSSETSLLPATTGKHAHDMMLIVRQTHWGSGWSVGAVGAVIVAVGLIAARRSMGGWLAASIGVVAIALSETLTGHAVASPARQPLAVAMDITHILGGGGWLGGLAAVVLAGFPALRAVDAGDRGAAASRLARAYHDSAAECVTIVVVTAIVSAWLRVAAFHDLWTTSYGRILLLKIVLVFVVAALGLYRRRRTVRSAWDEASRPRFLRVATAELVVGAFIVAATAAMVNAF